MRDSHGQLGECKWSNSSLFCSLHTLSTDPPGVGQWPRLEWLHRLLDPLSTSLSFRGIRCFHFCCEIHYWLLVYTQCGCVYMFVHVHMCMHLYVCVYFCEKGHGFCMTKVRSKNWRRLYALPCALPTVYPYCLSWGLQVPASDVMTTTSERLFSQMLQLYQVKSLNIWVTNQYVQLFHRGTISLTKP